MYQICDKLLIQRSIVCSVRCHTNTITIQHLQSRQYEKTHKQLSIYSNVSFIAHATLNPESVCFIKFLKKI